MNPKFITLRERIDELVEEHGSLRQVARKIEVDVAYLSRLRSGEKTQPSKVVTDALGLTTFTLYTKKNP